MAVTKTVLHDVKKAFRPKKLFKPKNIRRAFLTTAIIGFIADRFANVWRAYELSKIDLKLNPQDKDNFWGVATAALFPSYYAAYNIKKNDLTTGVHTTKHLLGQMLAAGPYASFQLARLHEQKLPQNTNLPFEKMMAIVASPFYGAYAATTLAEQVDSIFDPSTRNPFNAPQHPTPTNTSTLDQLSYAPNNLPALATLTYPGFTSEKPKPANKPSIPLIPLPPPPQLVMSL